MQYIDHNDHISIRYLVQHMPHHDNSLTVHHIKVYCLMFVWDLSACRTTVEAIWRSFSVAMGVTFPYCRGLLLPFLDAVDVDVPLEAPSTFTFFGGYTLSFRIRVGLPFFKRTSKTPFSFGAVAVAATDSESPALPFCKMKESPDLRFANISAIKHLCLLCHQHK